MKKKRELTEIKKFPAAIVDMGRVKKNIKKAAEFCREKNTRFRPHFKTHQSHEIGEIFREEGVDSIAVSSGAMARYFVSGGWKDITLAIVNPLHEIKTINKIGTEIRLNLLADNLEALEYFAGNLTGIHDIWLKIDAGYGRTGLNHRYYEEIQKAAIFIERNKKMNFAGLLSHFGDTYHYSDKEERRRLCKLSLERILSVKNKLRKNLGRGVSISLGDTPSFALIDDYQDISELRPGNFVFYDLMQLDAGVCNQTEPAMAVLCPVIGVYPDENKIAIHGGAVHLSKEYITGEGGEKIYGRVIGFDDNGFTETDNDLSLISLSQEHGIIKTAGKMPEDINTGDILAILPVHSCLAANMFDKYHTFNGKIIDRFCHCAGS